MEEQPLVSVLMTAYNREKYIAAAIESVLMSTYPNFELIIVDDQSTDLTVEIAQSYAAKDARIKVYINKINLGDYPNRNQAASYANGKYLKYLDSDDLIYPHGLATFVDCMEKHPEAALGICSRKILYDEPFPIVIKSHDAYHDHFFKESLLDYGPSGVIIDHATFKKLGGFSGKRMVGDSELWFKIAAITPVLIVPPCLTFWRRHEEQEFFSGVRAGLYLEMSLPMIKEILTSDKCPLSKSEKNAILKYYRKISARSLISMALKNREFKRARQLFVKFDLSSADFLNAVFFINKGIEK